MTHNTCAPMMHAPRILLSLVFLIGGFGFLMNFAGTEKFVAMGLTPFGLAGIAAFATVVAIVLKLGGSIMLFLNWKTSTAAWMLIIFTVLATIMYHLHWSGDAGQMQMTQFFKNLAIVGGLLMFAQCPCPTCKTTCKEGGSCCSKESKA